MRKIILFALWGLLLIHILYSSLFASDITVSGSAYFKCDFLSKYMVKHGYFLIKENVIQNGSKTNIYAASGADVIVINHDNSVIGKGKTDDKGAFSVHVPEDNSYKIIFRFHGQEIEKTVSYPEANNFIADLGYFSTEKVGDWIDARVSLR